MNAITSTLQFVLSFHDTVFLWILQKICYAHVAPTIAVFFFTMVCLPRHRRLGRFIAWSMSAFGLACLLVYNAWGEAPVLAWFLVGALAYVLSRWLVWRLPRNAADKPLASWHAWLHPRMSWTRSLLRAYLRVDPRGVYWFDLARAVRGLPIQRSSAERRGHLFSTLVWPAWRRRCWLGALTLVECLTQIARRLPRWWHRPLPFADDASKRTRLSLDEPYFYAILDELRENARRQMLLNSRGGTFDDYCERDAISRQEAEVEAGRNGREYLLYRDAQVEYQSFRTPWESDDLELVALAWRGPFQTWRQRRQFDRLWMRVETSRASPGRDDAPPAPTDSSEPPPQVMADAAVESPPDTADASAEDEGQTLEAVDGPPPTEADDSDESLFQDQPENEGPADVASDRPAERIPAAERISPRDRARLEDLRWASQMLEVVLQISPTGEFSRDSELASRCLSKPRQCQAAAMLLMLYCLRGDYTGSGVDRQKIELLIRTSARLSAAGVDRATAEASLCFHEMYLDLLLERGDYAELIERLQDAGSLAPYHRRLLGESKTLLARQLTSQPELRDMLRYEAIDHFFEAGDCEVWTWERANQLLGMVNGFEDFKSLLREHSVEVAPSKTWSIGDPRRAPSGGKARLRKTSQPLPASVPAPSAGAATRTSKPAPAKPAPSKPAPSKPAPAKPAPSKPAPPKPAPPSQPSPAKPIEVAGQPRNLKVVIEYSLKIDAHPPRRAKILPPLVIGSDRKQVHLHITAAGVAARHVQLVDHQGQLAVVDLTQRVGVSVNGGARRKNALLREGDRVEVDPVVFVVVSIERSPEGT